MLSRLSRLPYFTSAYQQDGLTPAEFNTLPALLSTREEFKGAMDKISELSAEASTAVHAS